MDPTQRIHAVGGSLPREIVRHVIAVAAVGTTGVTRNDYVHTYLAMVDADGASDNLIATSEYDALRSDDCLY